LTRPAAKKSAARRKKRGGARQRASATLNHTIVWCSDPQKSAGFLTEILGLPPPRRFLSFLVVDLANEVSLDYMAAESEPVALQHFAFLITEAEFDAALPRVRKLAKEIWADPARRQPGRINHHFGGRGVYFEDPDGHLLELITRPYGDPAEL
jgi:catechol 2,3-dioxygenase-like lactoylglutathione lyase family enzyme